mmetsp:Transcript_8618/g.22280  ORF Transcript_8618/g.22280 Transcript_8618/m.22280 type:complete len:320 (+) Transcript_8618:125-1084(+)
MAEAPPVLSDFFAKKTKKKIKGSNLNNSTTATKPEAKKSSKKVAEEEGWEEEEQIVAATIKVEVAGKLTRDEDIKDQEDTAAPAWGKPKDKGHSNDHLNEKRYPTLAKSVGMSSNINIDDGSDAKINIQTSKNAFSALETAHDSDDDMPRRPKEIKPAMVQKAKGERQTVAVAREVSKYATQKTQAAKKKKKEEVGEDEDEDEDEDEEDEEAIQEEVVEAPVAEVRKKKKVGDKKEDGKDPAPEPEEVEEDVKIAPDLKAAKAKYAHRKKLPPKPLPLEELEEEKENRPVSLPNKKKKKAWIDEEEEYNKGKKLAYIEE